MFKNILLQLKDNEYLDFAGIHYYSGTQKKLKKVIKEVAMLEEFAKELQDEYGVATDILEYGPGLLFNYFEGEETPSFEEQLSELKDILKNIKSFKHITLEMGRFIASECGYYCTEVVDRKCNNGSEYAIVDGGIHQINYYIVYSLMILYRYEHARRIGHKRKFSFYFALEISHCVGFFCDKVPFVYHNDYSLACLVGNARYFFVLLGNSLCRIYHKECNIASLDSRNGSDYRISFDVLCNLAFSSDSASLAASYSAGEGWGGSCIPIYGGSCYRNALHLYVRGYYALTDCLLGSPGKEPFLWKGLCPVSGRTPFCIGTAGYAVRFHWRGVFLQHQAEKHDLYVLWGCDPVHRIVHMGDFSSTAPHSGSASHDLPHSFRFPQKSKRETVSGRHPECAAALCCIRDYVALRCRQ